MTERIFKTMLRKLEKGEYSIDDISSLYDMIVPKSYKDTSKFENKMRYFDFCRMFDEKKYALEYMFNGKIRYIGTNNLNYIVVE